LLQQSAGSGGDILFPGTFCGGSGGSGKGQQRTLKTTG
jgi:hypothetical protein